MFHRPGPWKFHCIHFHDYNYQQLLAEYEKAMQAHRELMAERKRATDRRSRPEDDGERAAKRRRVRVDERRRQLNFHVSVPVGRKQAPI